MIKKEVKRLLPEINHWANGGVLYWYDSDDETWRVIENWSLDCLIDVPVVIEDKHLETRKAYALGEEIQYSINNGKATYIDTTLPTWDNSCVYRPKPKEPIYEWQWAYLKNGEYLMSEHYTEEEVLENPEWTRFEPSKRLRK